MSALVFPGDGPRITLGIPWLEKHNPVIDWRARSMTFDTGEAVLPAESASDQGPCNQDGPEVKLYSARACLLAAKRRHRTGDRFLVVMAGKNISQEDFDKFARASETFLSDLEIAGLLPEHLKGRVKAFSQARSRQLPPCGRG